MVVEEEEAYDHEDHVKMLKVDIYIYIVCVCLCVCVCVCVHFPFHITKEHICCMSSVLFLFKVGEWLD